MVFTYHASHLGGKWISTRDIFKKRHFVPYFWVYLCGRYPDTDTSMRGRQIKIICLAKQMDYLIFDNNNGGSGFPLNIILLTLV